MLNQVARADLAAIFGTRMTLDKMECRIYSHDVGAMPKLVAPLLHLSPAEAVVQPENEDELVRLVRWSAEHGVPLTPRGKATSGYGGAVPYRGGVVVDFYRMRGVVSIDSDQMTVTVLAGTVWQPLEKELAPHGLALRLYPSSAPSSTVGGWLAQGGFGFGSFEYGSFADNVVSARVVQPSGEVVTFSGDRLELVSEAEGITGLISTVTLRLRPLEKECLTAIAFGDRKAAIDTILDSCAARLPLWSLTMSNATMNSLRAMVPAGPAHGETPQAVASETTQGYIVTAVYPASRQAGCEGPLLAIAAGHGGRVLDPTAAEGEWDHRFKIMSVKRVAPSLIPFEVRLPLAGLGPTLADVEQGIALPVAAEVMIANGLSQPEAVILGFMPHDERKLAYNVAFGASLSALETAKKHGGRAYSTGLYFIHEAAAVLGQERFQRLSQYKRSVDPGDLLNPGKVVSGPAFFRLFMETAALAEPLAKGMANLLPSAVGERFATKAGIPGDVAWYAYACAQCGYCVDDCDEFYGRGWESHSPRGKWFYLREVMEGRASIDQEWTNKFLSCTTCEYCNVRCPVGLPIEPAWLKMRGKLIHEDDHMTFPPFEMMAASLRQERNIWAARATSRDAWLPDDLRAKLPERAEIAYFAGCTASFVEPDIARGTVALLQRAGVEFTYLGQEEACCGIPMLASGRWEVFETIMRHNIEAATAKGVKTVVTSCPACWLVWSQYYPQHAKAVGITYPIQARHYSELVAAAIAAGKLRFEHEIPMTVTYHDPCHMGRAGGIYEPPRELLKAIPGLKLVEMEHNREHAHCCGSVLTLVSEPPVAATIGAVRLQEAEATGAEAIVASCPCCEVQLRVTAKSTGREMPVHDLASFAARGLGIELPDPTPYALYMWSVFEAMIDLMTPEGMAGLMRDLLPQMFAAMPAYMISMMRAAKSVPGALTAMGGMMPRMMPMLMPTIMPKVMPEMLRAIGAKIEMPDTMRALMPDLLPPTMEALMPHMLPMVAPLLVPDMLAYIRENL